MVVPEEERECDGDGEVEGGGSERLFELAEFDVRFGGLDEEDENIFRYSLFFL